MAINFFRHIFGSSTPYYDYIFVFLLALLVASLVSKCLSEETLTSKPLLKEYVFAKAAFNIYTRLFCSEVPGPENHSGKMSAEEVFKSY